MNIHSKAADAGFPFEERDRGMALGVFNGRTEIVNLWLEDKAFLRNLKMLDLVVLLGVENAIFVGREVLAEMHIVAVRSEAGSIIWFNYDLASLHRSENFRVSKNHKPPIVRSPSLSKDFLSNSNGRNRFFLAKHFASIEVTRQDADDMSSNAPLIIAIDGPAASGKSTVARRIAAELGAVFVNSGAMYRAFTWWVLENGIDPSDEAAVVALLGKTQLESGESDRVGTVSINGKLMSRRELSEERVNSNVSAVASVVAVRERLVSGQREYAESNSVVMEGRDIGSVVFPETPFKFYIDASPEVREQRRRAEGIEDSILARDKQDSSRKASPLVIPDDALVVDSSYMGIDEVVATVISAIREQQG